MCDIGNDIPLNIEFKLNIKVDYIKLDRIHIWNIRHKLYLYISVVSVPRTDGTGTGTDGTQW